VYRGLGISGLVRLYHVARPYQREAIRRLLTADSGIVSLPTGAGKTLVGLAWIGLQLARGKYPVLILVPTGVLADQWASAIGEVYGDVVEVARAGREVSWEKPVVIATYAMAQRRPELLEKAIAVLVDEAHHMHPGAWEEITVRLASKPYKLGITASTPPLLQSLGVNRVLGRILFYRSIGQLRGFLAPAVASIVAVPGVERVSDMPPEAVADTVEELGHAGFKKTLVLSTTWQLAREIAEELRRRGLKVYEAYGTARMSREELARNLEAFAREERAVLVATPVMLEGVDIPEIDSLVIATPEKSVTRILQAVGRALRPRPGKVSAIVVMMPEIAGSELEKTVSEVLGQLAGRAELDELAGVVSELAREGLTYQHLFEIERKLAGALEKPLFVMPEDLAAWVAEKMSEPQPSVSESEIPLLQRYMWYYYLNIRGDPDKAARSFIMDVRKATSYAGDLPSWLLGGLARADLSGVDDASQRALAHLDEALEMIRMERKMFKRILEKLPVAKILVPGEYRERLDKLVRVLERRGLIDRFRELMIIPVSDLHPVVFKKLARVKAEVFPELVEADWAKGLIPGTCSLLEWMVGVCIGVPYTRRNEYAAIASKAGLLVGR